MSIQSYDIVIVGGGVIGTSIAYYISKERDLSVALVDIKKPGNASRTSAGGLWPIGESVGLGCGVIFFKTFSKQMASSGGACLPQRPPILPEFFFDFCLKSNALFPDLWQEFKENYGMDFKLENTGLKFIIYDDHDKQYAERIAESIPHLKHHLRWLDADELSKEEPSVTPEAIGALMFLNDNQVNPYLLVQAYREAARQNGTALFLESEVRNVIANRNEGGLLKTDCDTLSYKVLINAAGAWASDIAGMAINRSIPVTPVKGQILLSEKMPKLFNSCLSTSDCYIAQKDNGEILIGSTTEEKGYDTSCTYGELRSLSEGAVRCIPALREINIKRAWAGLRPGTPDEIPILGPVDGINGYLNACGHFRTGILTSAITGKILSALVHNRPTPVDLSPFLLKRFDDLHS